MPGYRVSHRIPRTTRDYIFLWYEVRIPEDMMIADAIAHVNSVITKLEDRREQALGRRLDPLLGVFDRGSFDADIRHVFETEAMKRRGLALGMLCPAIASTGLDDQLRRNF